MHGDGDICTSGISHPVFLNPSLPPVGIKPGHNLLPLEYTWLILSVSTCRIIILSFKMSLKKDQSEGCFLDVLLLTFSGHSSCPSAVYPGCVYREGWRVSTCSPSPAGMQSKGELEGEKGHTCRALKPPQVLKEEQRSEMSGSR